MPETISQFKDRTIGCLSNISYLGTGNVIGMSIFRDGEPKAVRTEIKLAFRNDKRTFGTR